MLIVCPSCATYYQVEAATLGEQGRTVRCARCQTVWLAAPPVETVGGGDAAWSAVPDRPADPWAAADLAGETSESDPPSPADDAAAESEEAAPAWAGRDPGSDQPPAADAFAGAADPITITDAPSVTPAMPADVADAAGASPTIEDVREDIETVAARRAQLDAERSARFRHGLTTLIVALVALNTALIGWRADVVKMLPQSASLFATIGLPVNLRGLVFTGVTSTENTQDGVTVVVVEGNIMNTTSGSVDVPRLRLALRDQDGHEVYSWTVLPARSVLGAQEVLPFRSRLASPPAGGRNVVVRFFNRHDAIDITR